MAKGGKRIGGKPKGYKAPRTLKKEEARKLLRDRVTEKLLPMIDAQIANASGISHFMLRDPKTGKFERISNPDQIQAALNAEGAEEGSSYYIWTKDPSVQAFTDLLNRTLDKPSEHVEVTGKDEGPIAFKWQS